MLHLASGLPMAVISMHRVARARYRFHVWDVIRHQASGDRQADVHAILSRMNEALSRSIEAYPEQWFWGGRRYRERPAGEVPGPDGLPPACTSTTATPHGESTSPARAREA